jgi:HEPN/RES N-terminal domain 1/RES domain
VKYQRHAVCASCLEEDDLEEFIRSFDGEPGCSFCKQEDAPTCRFDIFFEHLNSCLKGEYDLAANWLPYESAEGGWLWNDVWDTPELITDQLGIGLPRDDDGSLLKAIAESLGYEEWCVADPYGEDPLDALRGGWERFTVFVKHHARFFLDRWSPAPRPYDSLRISYTPAQILHAIGDRIARMDLTSSMPENSRLYRVRRFEGAALLSTPTELGPPDSQQAVVSNRMSPPGVVMFYAAYDPDTALAETVGASGTYAIAEFRTLRPARILDLSRLPEIPGFFAELPDSLPWNRRDAQFFQDLVKDFSRPIERDDRVHIEYIPTQVFTEYCRLAWHSEFESSSPLEGIIYPSARRPGQLAVVLFANRNSIRGAEEDSVVKADPKAAWIELVEVGYRDVSSTMSA